MTRPQVRLASIAALAGVCSLLTGCATFSENDLAARAGDAELTHDELAEMVSAKLVDADPSYDPADPPGRVDAGTQRTVVGDFVTVALLKDDLIQLGLDVPEVDAGLSPSEHLDAEFAAVGRAWLAAPPEQLADAELQAWYEQGPSETGYLCGQHILVASADEADAVIDRLTGGESFADVAADVSIDAQSSQQGGSIGCNTLDDVANALGPEYVDTATTLALGEPSSPVATDAGYFVIELTPFAQLAADNVIYGRLLALGDWADVYTDPAIGVYDALGVTPLG